jgi:hypothetical protein
LLTGKGLSQRLNLIVYRTYLAEQLLRICLFRGQRLLDGLQLIGGLLLSCPEISDCLGRFAGDGCLRRDSWRHRLYGRRKQRHRASAYYNP